MAILSRFYMDFTKVYLYFLRFCDTIKDEEIYGSVLGA